MNTPAGPALVQLRPSRNLDALDIPAHIVEELLLRTLAGHHNADLPYLAEHCALPGQIIEATLERLKSESLVEINRPDSGNQRLRYALTNKGKIASQDANSRCGYVGPAPIAFSTYKSLVESHSHSELRITRQALREQLHDLVIPEQQLDSVGAAMNSSKATFVYGPAGTGKSYVCRRLSRVMKGQIPIPHAVLMGDNIVTVFDSILHEPVVTDQAIDADVSLYLNDNRDARLVLCNRPFIVTGGELEAEMLEMQFDAGSNYYVAPLQLKANNGVLMIDDLGRQKVPVTALFNRWIVPMETGHDYHSTRGGVRVEFPFDVKLIFSTNLSPEDLDDPAFQRRVGHKVEFIYSDVATYSSIWQQECEKQGINCDDDVFDYLINELHVKDGVNLQASHPRDLVGMAIDFCDFAGRPRHLDREALDLAWKNFFAR